MAIFATNFGDAFDDIVFSQLVYMRTHSALLSSCVFVVKILSSFVSIFFASKTKHLAPKQLVIWAELGECLAVAVFLVGSYWQVNLIGLTIGVTSIQALCGAISAPGKNRLLSQLIPKDQVLATRSFVYSTNSLLQLFGYICGAWLLARLGLGVCAVIDMVSFLVGIACLLTIRDQVEQVDKAQIRSVYQEIRSGIKLMHAEKITLLVLLVLLGNLAVAPFENLLVVYFNSEQSTINYGIALGVFLLVNSLASMGIKKISTSVVQTLLIGFGSGCLSLLCLLSQVQGLVLLGVGLMGLSEALVSLIVMSQIQIKIPEHYIGEAFALVRFLGQVLMPISLMLVGSLIDHYNFKSGVIFCLIPMLIALILSQYKKSH